jgi:chromosome segregation ATPase
MQALDVADLQLENLSSKVKELENNIQQKEVALENLESSRGKAVAKLSATSNKLKDLHQLSEGLLAEVENLQLKLESRDAEISRLRQEVTRCTNDVLASQENVKRKGTELQELQAWLETMVSKLGVHERLLEDREAGRTHALLGALENRIAAIISESESFQVDSKSKDVLLQDTGNKMQELSSKVDLLEASLRDKQAQVESLHRERSSGLGAISAGPEVSEIEEIVIF